MVDVENDGNVWVTFMVGSDPKVVLSPYDLGAVVAFVEKHGQVQAVERD